MTSMRICERHERAYPSDGHCEWCEPETASAQPDPSSIDPEEARRLYDLLTYEWAAECGIPLDQMRGEYNGQKLVTGDEVTAEYVGDGRLAVTMSTRRVDKDSYECARLAGVPLDTPLNHPAIDTYPGGVVRDPISGGNILAVGVSFPEFDKPIFGDAGERMRMRLLGPTLPLVPFESERYRQFAPMSAEKMALLAGVNEQLDTLMAAELDRLVAAERERRAAGERSMEAMVARALRRAGASEADVADVLANKAERVQLDADGRIVVVLPGVVKEVSLSFGFKLDEP